MWLSLHLAARGLVCHTQSFAWIVHHVNVVSFSRAIHQSLAMRGSPVSPHYWYISGDTRQQVGREEEKYVTCTSRRTTETVKYNGKLDFYVTAVKDTHAVSMMPRHMHGSSNAMTSFPKSPYFSPNYDFYPKCNKVVLVPKPVKVTVHVDANRTQTHSPVMYAITPAYLYAH